VNTHAVSNKKFHVLEHDLNTGKVQKLIDNGWTILQIAKKYDVSESTIRKQSKLGRLDFMESRNRGSKAEEIALLEQMTPAKRLALSGKW